MTFGDVELRARGRRQLRAPLFRNELRKELGLLFDVRGSAFENLFLGRCVLSSEARREGNEPRRTHKTRQFSVSRSQSVCYL